MALLKWDRDEVIWLPTRLARRFHNAAMHWDGTYRDRLAGTDPGEFWSDFQYKHFEGPASPSVISAKHLAE